MSGPRYYVCAPGFVRGDGVHFLPVAPRATPENAIDN